MVGRMAPRDVVERLFLMDIDEHRIDHFGQSGALDLVRLKNDVAVGQDDGRSNVSETLQHLEGGGKQPGGERIVEQVRGHPQQFDFARMLDTEALQCAQIVPIPELDKKVVENPPIAVAGVAPISALEMILQILLYAVVVEQRIVDIDQEDDRMRPRHWGAPATLLGVIINDRPPDWFPCNRRVLIELIISCWGSVVIAWLLGHLLLQNLCSYCSDFHAFAQKAP